MCAMNGRIERFALFLHALGAVGTVTQGLLLWFMVRVHNVEEMAELGTLCHL